MSGIFPKNGKGLTLMELTVAIFVVSLMIMVSASIAVIYINGRKNTMAMQQNMEEMGLALNQMAKEIRMSNCDTDDSGKCDLLSGASATRSAITVIDNLTGESVEYEFRDGNLYRNSEKLLSDVSGQFYLFPSHPLTYSQISSESDTYAADRIERITISIASDKDGGEMTLQTTVSLRSGYVKQ